MGLDHRALFPFPPGGRPLDVAAHAGPDFVALLQAAAAAVEDEEGGSALGPRCDAVVRRLGPGLAGETRAWRRWRRWLVRHWLATAAPPPPPPPSPLVAAPNDGGWSTAADAARLRLLWDAWSPGDATPGGDDGADPLIQRLARRRSDWRGWASLSHRVWERRPPRAAASRIEAVFADVWRCVATAPAHPPPPWAARYSLRCVARAGEVGGCVPIVYVPAAGAAALADAVDACLRSLWP